MEYLLGGCTGLLKEVETSNKTLLRLSQIGDQSLDKNVTCLCWSGGFGGYFEDELTVGYKDGTLGSYNYLTMNVNREYKLDSRCIYVTMLNHHFDLLTPEIYNRNSGSNLYPQTKKPTVYETNDRLLLAVTEGGYIYVFDWSVGLSENVATVKYLYKPKDSKSEFIETIDANKPDNQKDKVKMDKETKNSTNKTNQTHDNKEEERKNKSNKEKDKDREVEKYVGALFVYRYKAPLSDARVHSLMKNRLVLGGPNNPPVLFDLFTESILWTGKFPHETVLGLQSKLEISSLCFLEEVGDDTICVATEDSFVYVYDLKAQKDPVFEFNICDYRTIGLSKRLLSLPHEDFNTKHRRTLARAINEKYSQNNRKILRLTTRPSYKLYFPNSNGHKCSNTSDSSTTPGSGNNTIGYNKDNEEVEDDLEPEDLSEQDDEDKDLYKVNENVYIRLYNSVKKDYCNLYICDNFGTIYNLQFLTGVRLLHWIYKKVQPLVDQAFSDESKSDSGSAVTGDGRAKRPLESKTLSNMDMEDIKNLSDKDKCKIAEYLLEARKRLCSSSNNDKRMHFRRNHYSQFVCRILCCYNFHNGSVVDLKCLGDYLISAGLDRFSSVINIRTGKLVFRQYCNQKQTCILVKNKYLFKTFQDNLEFKLNEKVEGSSESTLSTTSPNNSKSKENKDNKSSRDTSPELDEGSFEEDELESKDNLEPEDLSEQDSQTDGVYDVTHLDDGTSISDDSEDVEDRLSNSEDSDPDSEEFASIDDDFDLDTDQDE